MGYAYNRSSHKIGLRMKYLVTGGAGFAREKAEDKVGKTFTEYLSQTIKSFLGTRNEA